MKRALWALVVAVPLVALLAAGFQHDPNAVTSPIVNRPAPVFALKTLGGKDLSSSRLRGKPAVVNFWASWCLDCEYEHPTLLRAWRTYGKSVTFVGIDYQDHESDAHAFLKKYGAGWTQLVDPDQHTAIDFGVYGVPETYFIDRKGVVRYKATGPVTWAVMTREIKKITA
jgi:cytochrome c biogenesis protein CcmG, thiol:disulfide interchange protein DsbE